MKPCKSVTACEHTSANVSAEIRKVINTDNPERIIEHRLVVTATCGDCGEHFHFPCFLPNSVTHKYPAVLNGNATMLSLPIKPGPAEPAILATMPPVIPTLETVPAQN